MKKLAFAIALLVLTAQVAFSQKIRYERSLREAENKSITENKPLAILVTMQPPPQVTNVLSGLEFPPVATSFNEHFINYKVAREDTASVSLIKKYSINSFPHFLFIDSKGGVILRRYGNMPPPLLENMIADVLAASSGKSLANFDADYARGQADRDFLRSYIDKRIRSGMSNNAALIEDYVKHLTVRELKDPAEIIYILKAGPLADGQAYQLLYAGNQKYVDSIFMQQPLNVRVAINTHIINNTMQSAIENRNITRALSAANVMRKSWMPDMVTGARLADSQMISFYRAIGDTTSMIRNAIRFYDQHYMRIGVDSIRSMQHHALEKARADAQANALLNMPPGASVASTSYSFAFPIQNFSGELNNGAWSIYMTGTRNVDHLTKALTWAKRSIELKPTAANHDTLAHILYRLNFYAEAEKAQQQAVSLARSENRDITKMQEELTKIRKRTL